MNFWKRKLLAYLHDPPSKCIDLKLHEQRSERAMLAAGFTEEEARAFSKSADITASSADRFPFPASGPSKLSCHFDGVRAGFRHPLGAGEKSENVLRFEKEVKGADAIEGTVEETEQVIQPVLRGWPSDWNEEQIWRARFFAHWRLWPKFAIERDYRYGFLPADTRLPDHTIWNHMSVVSALAGCAEGNEGEVTGSLEETNKALRNAVVRPAFLKVQIGAVQEFIAEARSTRDLWSGSYLVSWLMAAGLRALALKVGPDAIIFPSLRNQPLVDFFLKEEIWERARIGNNPIWLSIQTEVEHLLTPNLPNVFLAVVPQARGVEIGEAVAEAVEAEWKQIREAVWKRLPSEILKLAPLDRADLAERFSRQTEGRFAVSWQVTPWPERLDETRGFAAKWLPVGGSSDPEVVSRFDTIYTAVTEKMPKDHRDGRYYAGGESGEKSKLNNIGLGWALLTALNSWQLDAVRRSREFRATGPGRFVVGVGSNKDALTGREEMLLGGSGFSERVAAECGEKWSRFFKHDDPVGAMTLIKRLWHWAYLAGEKRINVGELRMPNTRGIARHTPFSDDAEEKLDWHRDDESGGNYYAVLVLDGDEMGKWVSGDKNPLFRVQFADYTDGTGAVRQGSREYFERGKQETFAELLQTKRLVSPSFHLQFSEALGSFAQWCVRPIVETFDGRLIYSGGDDVLALVPADVALECARALRMAFVGDPRLGGFLAEKGRALKKEHEIKKAGEERQISYYQKLSAEDALFTGGTPGFIARKDLVDQTSNKAIPFLVPGPHADCSVGIAMAHFKAPLQDVVRAAQTAEKRAKTALGRKAVAMTLMKRSGEIVEWGCKWESGGLELISAIQGRMADGTLSGKFPHRVTELVTPYIGRATGLTGLKADHAFVENIETILNREFAIALERQCLKPRATGELWKEMEPLISGFLKYVRGHIEGRLDEKRVEKQESLEKITDGLVQAVIGLCQTVAFTQRIQGERDSKTEESGVSKKVEEVHS